MLPLMCRSWDTKIISVCETPALKPGKQQHAVGSKLHAILLQGSPRIDGFHVLIVGLPQGRDNEE